MPSWTTIVQCFRRNGKVLRYFSIDFDPKGSHIRGPDGGKDHSGYTESEIRDVLAGRGFAEREIQSLIDRANSCGEPYATPTR